VACAIAVDASQASEWWVTGLLHAEAGVSSRSEPAPARRASQVPERARAETRSAGTAGALAGVGD
jgi:hypothetical protein